MKNKLNEKPNYLQFKFEYKNYKNPTSKKLSPKNIVFITIFAMIPFIGIIKDTLLLKKSNDLNIEISTHKVDKHNKLSVNYEYDFNTLTNVRKSEFLKEFQKFTLHYDRINETQYTILHNYIKSNPEFYIPAINILVNNNQPVVALLLQLDIALKYNNKYQYEDSFNNFTSEIINNELSNPLIIKIAENKFLSKEFKEKLAQQMIIKLNSNILVSEQKYKSTLAIKFSKSDIKDKLNITDTEIDNYIRSFLLSESLNTTNSIFKLYPEAPKYYDQNRSNLTGITKIINNK